MTAGSMSAEANSVEAPRKVDMVRSPSGVTLIIETAVALPSSRGGVSKWAPMARMSWVKTLPSWSSATLPRKAPRPPNEATPAMELAADPPEASTPGAMAV